MAVALDVMEADEGIGCIIVTGSEKAFAAGADVSEMCNKNFIDLMKNDFILPWEKLSKFRKPVIAAVSGLGSSFLDEGTLGKIKRFFIKT